VLLLLQHLQLALQQVQQLHLTQQQQHQHRLVRLQLAQQVLQQVQHLPTIGQHLHLVQLRVENTHLSTMLNFQQPVLLLRHLVLRLLQQVQQVLLPVQLLQQHPQHPLLHQQPLLLPVLHRLLLRQRLLQVTYQPLAQELMVTS
jgi:hypothetical protein